MRKSKLLLLSILAVLMACMSVKTTLAYFSDYEKAKGSAVVHLKGEAEIEENIVDDNKEITVKNTGETDLIVRVKVFYKGDFVSFENKSGKWQQDKESGWWYYRDILPVGAGTEILRAIVSKEGAPDWDFQITVIMEYKEVAYDENGKVIIPSDDWTYQAY